MLNVTYRIAGYFHVDLIFLKHSCVETEIDEKFNRPKIFLLMKNFSSATSTRV